MSVPVIPGMECRVDMPGVPYLRIFIGVMADLACIISAEAVVGMIIADIAGIIWSPPEWFPHHFSTIERCK